MLKFADITCRGGSHTFPENRRGFALPVVLMLLVVLSTVTAFLLASSSDAQRSGRAIRESARSFYAADAGVNQVLSDWQSQSYAALAPNPGDSADLGWDTLENGTRFRAVLTQYGSSDRETAPLPARPPSSARSGQHGGGGP